jgi:murein DD-endopeptidase MepM/ murein hydrolase activator NlpD
MVSSVGRFVFRTQRAKLALGLSGAIAAAVAGGCSADVARFDFPGFSLTDEKDQTGAIQPPEPMRAGSRGLSPPPPADTGMPSAARREGGVQMSALPEPPSSSGPPPAAVAPSLHRAPSAPAAAHASPQGDKITVVAGDTLFGLSKRHGVSVSELMAVNHLSSPNLKPGQELVLPASGNGKRLVKRPPAAVAAAPAAAPVAHPAANWEGSYTIKQGDSLYALSRQHKVSLAELQQVNGITDPRKVRPGTVIKVPLAGGALPPAAVADAKPATPFAAPAPATVAAPALAASGNAAPAAVASEPPHEPPRVQSTTQPTIINAEKRVAALTDKASDAAPVSAPVASEPPAAKGEQVANAAGAASGAGAGKLRWPVQGKIIAPFGPRPDGTHNDGVNIAVPMGTEVHAAEAGVVAYAGSELKGYGNLILLRHDNGMVTAYAHNEELLVKRGDKVRRGQVLAKAGKTGQVDQPQVHFELRQGSKPVDPMPFLDKL